MAPLDNFDSSRTESCFVIDSILSYYTDILNKDQNIETKSPISTTDYIAVEDVGRFPLPPSNFATKTHNLFTMSSSSKSMPESNRTQRRMNDITIVSDRVGSIGDIGRTNLELQTNSVSQTCSVTKLHRFFSRGRL